MDFYYQCLEFQLQLEWWLCGAQYKPEQDSLCASQKEACWTLCPLYVCISDLWATSCISIRLLHAYQPCLSIWLLFFVLSLLLYNIILNSAIIQFLDKAFDLRFHSFDQWFYDKYFIGLLSILSCLYTNWESILWCIPQSKRPIINSCMKLYGLPLRDATIRSSVSLKKFK